MMLHHPTRRPAGTAGVDQAGKVLARHREAARLRFLDMRLADGDEAVPVVDRDLALLPDAQAFHDDDEAGVRAHRMEARRVGNEGVMPVRSRRAPDPYKNKNITSIN